MNQNILAAPLAAALTFAASEAATLSWSDTAPAVDGADIANFVGVTADGDNINGGDDQQTYIAGGRPQQGQTFTTGVNGGQGFELNSITLQHVTYSTFWSVDSGWSGIEPVYVRVGTIDGVGTFTADLSVTADLVDSGNPALEAAGGQSGTGSGWYVTVAFDTPLALNDSTTYAFTFDTLSPYMELNGDGTTDANYGGGSVFTLPQGSDTGTADLTHTGDRVFHLDMTAVPEPTVALLGGLGILGLLRRRRA